MPLQQKRADDRQSLHDSGAETVTGTGTAVRLPGLAEMKAVALVLDVTAAATEVGDTLDVKVQTRFGESLWVDVVAFTQVLGNGSAKRYIAKIITNAAESMFADAVLAAGSVRNLLGEEYRAVWAIVDAGTDNASFTFSVTAIPM